MPEDEWYYPAIHIYFNDDLTEAWKCVSFEFLSDHHSIYLRGSFVWIFLYINQ